MKTTVKYCIFSLLVGIIACENREWDNPNDPNRDEIIYGSVSDIEGNNYKTIRIYGKTWMAENLKTTKYNDGNSIPNITSGTEWSNLNTGAFCYYNNNINHKETYGALYNWYAVKTNKLCPKGWHVPDDYEWKILEMNICPAMTWNEADDKEWRGGDLGKQMKTTSGWLNNGNGTNNSGFSALPEGYRSDENGLFYDIGLSCYWWSSSEYSTVHAWGRYLFYSRSTVCRLPYAKKNGLNVRCVKN